jgi:hypothetical protein
MKKIAIMQPTYLPWLGYFSLISRVDTFVILDCVQFSRRSWQQRNKVKCETGEKLLTIPVDKKSKRGQLINETALFEPQHSLEQHLNIIKLSYKDAPFFNDIIEPLTSIYQDNHQTLTELLLALIIFINEYLNITTPIILSSELSIEGNKDTKLANICETLAHHHYISVEGSRNYLEDSEAFISKSIKISYHQYKHPQYSQLHGEFIPFLSIIDLLFNHGKESKKIINSGLRELTE